MKGPVKLILISVGAFVVLVGVIFVVLLIFEPSSDETPIPEENIAKVNPDNPDDENSIESSNSESDGESGNFTNGHPTTVTDSLANLVQELKNDLFERSLEIDSLKEQITFQNGLINGYKKTIDGLNSQILALNKKEVSLKELAKTYESMKVSDIKPILDKVDDETVIAIYRAMGTRTRKSIMMALSAERAATITEKLAGINGDKS